MEKKGLSRESVDTLMTKAFALTHRIHAADKNKTQWRKGTPERKQVEADAQSLRDQRDLIVREIKRRAGEL